MPPNRLYTQLLELPSVAAAGVDNDDSIFVNVDGVDSRVPVGDFPAVFGIKLYPDINAKDSGLLGNDLANESIALQALINTFNVGSNEALNRTVRIPAGVYRLNTTITIPENVGNFSLIGDGGRSTIFEWHGTAGQPMFKCNNTRSANFEGLGFHQGTTKPSYGIQFDKPAASAGAAPMYNTVRRCTFGGDMALAMGVGIGFTAGGAFDANNEQSLIEQCEFNNCDKGIHYQHSNSLWHKVFSCDFETCIAGISNFMTGAYGGGFTAIGCNFADTAKPLEIGASRYPIQVIGCNSEGSVWAIYTPEPISLGFGGLHVIGGLWYVGSTVGTTGVKWDCNASGANARLVLDNVMFIGSGGTFLDFPGRGPVYIRGGSFNNAGTADVVKYAGFLYMENQFQGTQAQVYSTPYALDSGGLAFAGALKLVIDGSTNNGFVMPALAANILNLRGYPSDISMGAAFGGATTLNNITSEIEGQKLTIFASNGNLTVSSFAGIFLSGTINWNMPTGATLSLIKRGGGWYETSRMVP